LNTVHLELLTVSNEFGESTETKTEYITVGYAPVPDFYAEDSVIAMGEVVQFFDASMYEPDTYLWVFEGGIPHTSAEQNPEVTYEFAGDFDVALSVSNMFGDDFIIKTNYIHVTVGYDELTANGITIYPNPSSGLFNLELPKKNIEIKVYTIVGELVITKVTEELNEILDLSAYNKGIYFINLIDKETGNQFTQKLIIN